MGSTRRFAFTALLTVLAILLSPAPTLAQSQPESADLVAFPGSLVMIPLSGPARSAETDVPGAKVEVSEMYHIELRERGEITEAWRPVEISRGLWAVLMAFEQPKVMYGEKYELNGSLRVGDLLVIPPGILAEDPMVAKFESRVENFTFTEANGTLVLAEGNDEVILHGALDNETGAWLFLDVNRGYLYRLRSGALGRYSVLSISRAGAEVWYASDEGSYVLICTGIAGTAGAYVLNRAIPVTGEISFNPSFEFIAVRLPSEEVVRILSPELQRKWAALISVPANASVKTYKVVVDGRVAYRLRLTLPSERAASLQLPEAPAVAGSEIKATLQLSGHGGLNVTMYLTDPPLSASLALPDAGPGELPISIALPHLDHGASGSIGAHISLNDTTVLSIERGIGILPSVQLICLNGSDVYARAGDAVRLIFELLNRGDRNMTVNSTLVTVDGANLTFPPSFSVLGPDSAGITQVELNLSPGLYRVVASSRVCDEAFGLILEPTVGPIEVHILKTPLTLRVDLPEEALPLIPFNLTLTIRFGAPAKNVDLNVTVPRNFSVSGSLTHHVDRVSPNETLNVGLQMTSDRPGRFPVHIAVEGTFPWGRVIERRTVNVTVGAIPHSYAAMGPLRAFTGSLVNVSLRVGGPAGVAVARFPDGFTVVASNGTLRDNLTLEFPVPGTVWITLRAGGEPGSYLLPVVVTVNNTIIAGDPLRIRIVERAGVTREELIGLLTELRRRVRTLRERSLLPWATSPAGLGELEDALNRAESQIEAGDYQSAANTLSEVEDELSQLEAAPRRELDPIVPLTITLLTSSVLLLWAALRWERVGE